MPALTLKYMSSVSGAVILPFTAILALIWGGVRPYYPHLFAVTHTIQGTPKKHIVSSCFFLMYIQRCSSHIDPTDKPIHVSLP